MVKIDIPKIIHYCWFGKNKKPKLVLDCIASWKLFFPDYQLLEWNEETYISDHPFYVEAMQNKLWAFASDYARLDILNRYGGIYFDTDLLVVKSFGHLLNNEIIIGAEDENFIAAGFIGAIKNHTFLVDCLNFYDHIYPSVQEDDLMKMTIPKVMTNVLFDKYLAIQEFSSVIDKQGISIFPPEFFYPLPYNSRMELNNYTLFLTENSVAVHLWNASWKKFSALYYFEHKHFLMGMSALVREIHKREIRLSKPYVKKLLKSLFIKN